MRHNAVAIDAPDRSPLRSRLGGDRAAVMTNRSRSAIGVATNGVGGDENDDEWSESGNGIGAANWSEY